MDRMVDKLRPLLLRDGIAFRQEGPSLFVVLPGGFGELEVADLDDGGDIVALVDDDWHTHSDLLVDEGDTPAERIVNFIKDILSGRYLCIIEQEQGRTPAGRIEDDLQAYLKYLPGGTTYRILNDRSSGSQAHRAPYL